MKKSTLFLILCLTTLMACGKRTPGEQKAFQFAVDMMSVGAFKDGNRIDSLTKHFDIPVDSEGIMRLRQTWIPWGKSPIGQVSLRHKVTMRLKDGIHYYMVINLDRYPEIRAFNYLVEVFDSGSKLWLRQFNMYETNDHIFQNISIKKKKDGAVWMVRTSLGRGEFDGKHIKVTYKFPPF